MNAHTTPVPAHPADPMLALAERWTEKFEALRGITPRNEGDLRRLKNTLYQMTDDIYAELMLPPMPTTMEGAVAALRLLAVSAVATTVSGPVGPAGLAPFAPAVMRSVIQFLRQQEH